ncbi:hypothetical protein CICLE_v10013775mg [Citrus x clementina]|uniref:Pectate lyase n=1 Tax=Citrus clementina TaxID=85681 RepID=V4SUA4_CITCL|nr:hypothetical protein CICLE_v10013775mg [Citrus x clementina]
MALNNHCMYPKYLTYTISSVPKVPYLRHKFGYSRFLGGNIIRRKLLRHEKHNGPRVATNLIVWCWRCQNDWANNRHKLADCTLSFDKHATGGKHGPIYMVTDSSDNQRDHKNLKLRTLRLVVTQKGPLWIIFERNLSKMLQMIGNKTIDGHGVDVHNAHGGGIGTHQVKNVIIHELHIHNIVHVHGSGDGDGISIYGSIAITISNSHFIKHDKLFL